MNAPAQHLLTPNNQAAIRRFGAAALQPQTVAQGVPQGAQRTAVGQVTWGQTRTNFSGGNYAAAWADPNLNVNASSLPNVGPLGPPGAFVGAGQVIRQALVPISCISQAAAGQAEKAVQCFPLHGRMYINGIRAFNGPFEIILTRLTTGGVDANRLGNNFIDAAVFSSDDMYLPFDGGCVDKSNPLQVCFKSFGAQSDLPFLNLHFFGTRDQAWNSCEPGLALALNAAGQYPGAMAA